MSYSGYTEHDTDCVVIWGETLACLSESQAADTYLAAIDALAA